MTCAGPTSMLHHSGLADPDAAYGVGYRLWYAMDSRPFSVTSWFPTTRVRNSNRNTTSMECRMADCVG